MNSDSMFLDFIEFHEDISPRDDDFTSSIFKDIEIQRSIDKLLAPSKKIRKSISKRVISRTNAEKMAPFFQKWKEIKKRNKPLKMQIKHWFSSFNAKLNKTYIYKQISESVRIHFRLAVRENGYSFENLKDADWESIFLNLTQYLTNEMEKVREALLKGRQSQVYPVWIEEKNVFKIEQLPGLEPLK